SRGAALASSGLPPSNDSLCTQDSRNELRRHPEGSLALASDRLEGWQHALLCYLKRMVGTRFALSPPYKPRHWWARARRPYRSRRRRRIFGPVGLTAAGLVRACVRSRTHVARAISSSDAAMNERCQTGGRIPPYTGRISATATQTSASWIAGRSRICAI